MLISIIIPAHKKISYLKDCVKSALNQSYKNIEVIIACNNKLEPTECQSFLNIKDNRLYYIKTLNGRHNARNEALQFANGNYIQFLDYDDLLFSDKLEKQIAALSIFPGKNIISISKWKKFHDDINTNYKFPFKHLFKNTDISFFDLISLIGKKGGFIPTAAWLVPKKLIKDIRWIEVPNDDAVFFSELFSKNPLILMIDKTLVGYRMHESNTSTIKNKKQFDQLIKGWSIIFKNLGRKKTVDIYKYFFDSYSILLFKSKKLDFYRFNYLFYLLIIYAIKSKQSPIKILKTLVK